jgi:hypothetical protein
MKQKNALEKSVFSPDEVTRLFAARAMDNGLLVEPDSSQRFKEYCDNSSIDRKVNL